MNTSVKETIRAWYTRLPFPKAFDAEFEKALASYEISADTRIEDYDVKSEDGKKNLLSYLYMCEETARRYAALGIPEDILLARLRTL